jgi:serine/threonine-protein kinase RsbW
MWSRSQEEPVVDIWWSLHLRREPASVPLARHILLGTMASVGVDPDVSHEVGVALTEACANAVEHAAQVTGTGQDSGFQVTAAIAGGCLRVEITDSSPSFSAAASPTRPRPCAAQSGRGRRRHRETIPGRPLTVVDDLLADFGPDDFGPDDFGPDGFEADGFDADGFGPGDFSADDFAPFPGLPADAGLALPDLDATSGRGLFLIRALMDHVQFRTHPRSGVVVSFDKTLKFREHPLLHAS